MAEDLGMKVEDCRKKKLMAETEKEHLEKGIRPDDNSKHKMY